MIGGGLALNDRGFILVQATYPTSSLSRSMTIIPEPRCSKFCYGVTNGREKDGGVQEVRLDSGLKGRE